MAWRIDELVICGEIDNRRRGRVTGRIWLAGHPEPVQLDLQGNCWRDLAGRCLRFTNPRPQLGSLACIDLHQAGVVGDITASRKVKVPDISMDRLEEYELIGKSFPWHWGNALYLEWFGRCNGRVVIDTATFNLEMVGEPVWDLSSTDERLQREATGLAIRDFMRQLNVGRTGACVEEGTSSQADYRAD